MASVEGTRSYGIAVTRALTAAGVTVIECEQPTRKARRGRGKSDAIDAHLAALFALSRETDRLPTPRADGTREALRILLAARAEMVTTSTGQINRLRALLLSGDDVDRRIARAAFTDRALASLARRRSKPDADRAAAVRHGKIRRLTVAIREASAASKTNKLQLRELVTDTDPGMLERPGIGPVSADQIIVSFSHIGRVRNDAAFAALAGTNPIPASSGNTQRHRLNAGGDRALNRAVHTIAQTRHAQLRTHPRLRRPPHRRRQEHPRNPPLPQALHHPRALPNPEHHHDHLTHIEASVRHAQRVYRANGVSGGLHQ